MQPNLTALALPQYADVEGGEEGPPNSGHLVSCRLVHPPLDLQEQQAAVLAVQGEIREVFPVDPVTGLVGKRGVFVPSLDVQVFQAALDLMLKARPTAATRLDVVETGRRSVGSKIGPSRPHDFWVSDAIIRSHKAKSSALSTSPHGPSTATPSIACPLLINPANRLVISRRSRRSEDNDFR